MLYIDGARLAEAVELLRDDESTDLIFLCNLTAVDRELHFEVVYHLQSLDPQSHPAAQGADRRP